MKRTNGHVKSWQVALLLAVFVSGCAADQTGITGVSAPALQSSSNDGLVAAASDFVVLANAAVTCTDGGITGNVGTFVATPTGSVTRTTCPITGTVQVGGLAAEQAFNDFLGQYASLTPRLGDVCTMLTGTLAAVSLAPGDYCFDAAATVTGLLTLDGPSDGIWVFKIGTSGAGALTGTSFAVALAGGAQASNVTWRVADAVTMTDSDLKGSILAGAAITLTRGSLHGNVASKADVTITGTAVTGIIGSLATITVTPNPDTMAANATQQFTAVGTDAGGNIVSTSPTWSVAANGGSISNTGLFTAGTVAGTFTNTVQASSSSISGFATVVVTVLAPPPPPPAASDFAVLANAAVTCTDGTITGNVGTFLATPTGSVTRTTCPITGTVQVGDGVEQAFSDFLSAYAALAPQAGDVCTTLTGTLDGVILAPGDYCFDAATTVTGVLTLNGPSNGIWNIKVGTSGTGALTGTGFNVVMAGGGNRCNVTWWVADAATMTGSAFQGHLLAGVAITLTGGTFNGHAWSRSDVTTTGTVVAGC